MNIFILDNDPVKAASYLCDKHLSKMLVESAQMLYAAHWLNGTPNMKNVEPKPYKLTHLNHPCTQWVSNTLGNYNWLCTHAKEIARQYTLTYGKVHKTEANIDWLLANYPPHIKIATRTDFVLAFQKNKDVFNKCFIEEAPVQSYRNFYRLDKARFAKWKNRPVPHWW